MNVNVNVRFILAAASGALSGFALLFLAAVLLGAPLALRSTGVWAGAQALATSAPLALALALDASTAAAAPAAAAPAPALALALDGGFSLLLRADALAVARRRRLLVLPALASLAGAWLGACLLPYDWGLAWQAWPEVSLRGAAAGLAAGAAAAAASRCCCGRSDALQRSANTRVFAN
jgi:phosphatidylinositol glycan class F